MLSIIIPTLNEEKYLPKLLDSIRKQSYTDYEVIVADSSSTDKTISIAKKFGCKVTSLKNGSPAKGRNHGSLKARGEYLIFFDADVTIPKDFLEKIVSQLNEKEFEIASCFLIPDSKNFADKFLTYLTNIYFYITQNLSPHASGMFIFIKKSIHKKISGFNEDLKLSEDHDYVIRASKYGKFKYLYKPRLKFSVRRLNKEGRMKLIIKYLYAEFYRIIFRKEISNDLFNYEFGKHE